MLTVIIICKEYTFPAFLLWNYSLNYLQGSDYNDSIKTSETTFYC